jgi:hypothetical protein
MSAVQSPDATDSALNGMQGVKRRRGSTILNPRSYVKDALWQQAPVLTGTTKFEALSDAKNILITGGAGFMYGQYHPLLKQLY